MFISASLSLLTYVWLWNWAAEMEWWQQDLLTHGQDGSFYGQLVIVVGALVLITVLAYLLQPFTRTIVRFYEGYWPLPLRGFFVSLPWQGESQIWKDKSKKRVPMLKKSRTGQNITTSMYSYFMAFHHDQNA